jgi:maltose O-acetyltransferase
VIGAGSVVTKSIEDNCIAVGNPARVVRELTVEKSR